MLNRVALDNVCPIRFGRWDNGSNAGVWYLTLVNLRTNANTNVSGRS
jgi:hypothetical protein